MEYRFVLMWVVIASLVAPGLAAAGWRHLDSSDIEVDIIDDGQYRPLSQYPVEDSRRLYRGYLEAKEGRGYEIRVRNKSDERIGVVISVDGRNIISGELSSLDNDERMYVLAPYETRHYRGWRTGKHRINRFYFTEAPDSFAGRWDDYSAMGMVAVAAYMGVADNDSRDKLRRNGRESDTPYGGRIAPRHAPLADEPGTGFGEGERSPARLVDFKPGRKSFARVYLKYEWRDSLCTRGIGRCYGDHRKGGSFTGRNRGGFARLPPRNDFMSSDRW